MLPAFSYLMYYLVCSYPANNERKMLIGVLAFALLFTVFTNDLFWGVKIGRVFQFLKLIVIGVIPVIPALAYFSPRKLLRLMAESNGCDIDQVESRRG